jgi:hypothetical protein
LRAGHEQFFFSFALLFIVSVVFLLFTLVLILVAFLLVRRMPRQVRMDEG